MMTTMAALLGGLPLALGTGTGSELHRPLGITIVGGLAVSQMLTLFTTPVVYVYLDRLRLACGVARTTLCPETSSPRDSAPESGSLRQVSRGIEVAAVSESAERVDIEKRFIPKRASRLH